MNWKIDPIEAATVDDAIHSLFSPNPFFTENHDEPQLYGHDFLHALLGAKSNSDTAEEVVAIYQAVFLGRADVATARPYAAWKHYGQAPTLEEIHSITVPGARAFVNETVERLQNEFNLDDATQQKFAVRNHLSQQEIDQHYKKALILRRLFEKEFHRHLGEISIDELKALPFPPLQKLLPRMENMYQLTVGRKHNPSKRLPSISPSSNGANIS